MDKIMMKWFYVFLLCYSQFKLAFTFSYHTSPTRKFHLKASDADAIDDNDISFKPKFDNQLIYGLEVNDEGQIQTSFKDIQKNSGIRFPDPEDDNSKPSNSRTLLNIFSNEVRTEYERERTKINKVPVISRRVPLGITTTSSSASTSTIELCSIIWEMEKPSDLVQNWMAASPSQKEGVIRDPFGVVMWPGSILASQEMHSTGVEDKTILILGAGTGVEVQAAAMLGAKKVIATDNNRFTLRLLKYGVERRGFGDIVQTKEFDIFSTNQLPTCDMVIAADILYNEQLAQQVARRCRELLSLPKNKRPQLIVTDSQKFHGTNFLELLREDYPNLGWDERILQNVTGSGILIEEDQTYDVKARILVIK